MSHLSMARSCKWYRKGKNPIRIGIDIPEPVEMEELVDNNGSEDMQLDDEDFEDVIQNRDLFRFVLPDQPVDGTSSVEASSSSAPRYVTIRPPILDDDDDDRTYEEDENAAAVIAMAPTVVEKWKAYFEDAGGEDRMDVDDQENEDATGKDAKWRPFASELDWKVASWIVREDVGQNSLNRFLSIPGVSCAVLCALPFLICALIGRGKARAELQGCPRALHQGGHHPRQSDLADEIFGVPRPTRREALCTIPRHHRGHQGLAREPILCQANRLATTEGLYRRVEEEAGLL